MPASLEEIQMNTPLFAYSLGARDEQERIIKLLEEECYGDWPKVIEMSLSSIIAQIKGEQK